MNKKRGRPKIAFLFQRIPCGRNYRLPRYIVNWIMRQAESGGRLIERALVNFYKIERPRDEEKKKEREI